MSSSGPEISFQEVLKMGVFEHGVPEDHFKKGSPNEEHTISNPQRVLIDVGGDKVAFAKEKGPHLRTRFNAERSLAEVQEVQFGEPAPEAMTYEDFCTNLYPHLKKWVMEKMDGQSFQDEDAEYRFIEDLFSNETPEDFDVNVQKIFEMRKHFGVLLRSYVLMAGEYDINFKWGDGGSNNESMIIPITPETKVFLPTVDIQGLVEWFWKRFIEDRKLAS